jgi:hypothetical protein
MGGFTSAIAPALQIGKSIAPVISLATQAARIGQRDSGASKINRLDEQNALQRLQSQRALDAAQTEQYERNRALTLNRALSRQKANFAAQGISVNDNGSADTVLNSIIDDSDSESTYRTRIEQIKARADEMALQQSRQRNLLEEANARRRGQLSLASGLFS